MLARATSIARIGHDQELAEGVDDALQLVRGPPARKVGRYPSFLLNGGVEGICSTSDVPGERRSGLIAARAVNLGSHLRVLERRITARFVERPRRGDNRLGWNSACDERASQPEHLVAPVATSDLRVGVCPQTLAQRVASAGEVSDDGVG
jgi:hypothetical protein